MSLVTKIVFRSMTLLAFFAFQYAQATEEQGGDQNVTPQHSGYFTNVDNDVVQYLLGFCDTQGLLNLDMTCTRLKTLVDAHLSQRPYERKVKPIVRSSLLEAPQHRIPFSILVIKEIPSLCLNDLIPIDSPPIEFSNATLQSLTIQAENHFISNQLISQLTSLHALTDLHLSVSVASFENMVLGAFSTVFVQDISPLGQITTLKKLSLINFTCLGKNTHILSSLVELKDLTLNHCGIENLDCLSPLVNLEALTISRNPISHVSHIMELEAPLEISQIQPLLNLKNLTQLDLSDRILSITAVDALRTALPKLRQLFKGHEYMTTALK